MSWNSYQDANPVCANLITGGSVDYLFWIHSAYLDIDNDTFISICDIRFAMNLSTSIRHLKEHIAKLRMLDPLCDRILSQAIHVFSEWRDGQVEYGSHDIDRPTNQYPWKLHRSLISL